MKGDVTAFAIVAIVFLFLTLATAGVFEAYQQTEVILVNTMTGFGVPAAQQQVQQNLGGNLYQFDTYLSLVFYFVMLAIIFSTVFLNPDPLSWLVGIIFLPINYYISAWISNIARSVLTQAVLQNGVSYLLQSITILANLQTITFLFGLMYLVALAVRIWAFSPVSGKPSNQKLV